MHAIYNSVFNSGSFNMVTCIEYKFSHKWNYLKM